MSATCVRVPVMQSHSQAVHIETTDPITADAAREPADGARPGSILLDEPRAQRLPAAARGHRPRRGLRRAASATDASHPRGLALWVVSDNLRKGAATNAVQIAESLVTKGWL